MPWELTIQSSDGASLGDVAMVREKITASLPTVQFHVEQGGLERIAAARAMGIEFPDVLRKHMESRPASLQAEFEGDEFSIQLYGFESQPLGKLYVELRGNGNPMSALAALCKPNGWTAIDCATGQPIDLAATAAAGWDAFRSYRNRAVSTIMEIEELA